MSNLVLRFVFYSVYMDIQKSINGYPNFELIISKIELWISNNKKDFWKSITHLLDTRKSNIGYP